jgi:thymidylate kinase
VSVTLAETVLKAIEDAAPARALVFGSLPPAGRDLDLVVRDGDAAPIADALRRAGAIQRGLTWARFAAGDAYAVDLVPASSWGLPVAEVDALFGEACPVEGSRVLVAPSPAHTLLLLARFGVPPKRQARLRESLAAPGARGEAERRAAAWGVDLSSLERRPRRRPPLGPPRVVALSGLDGSGKSTQARSLAASLEAAGFQVHVEWTPILQNRSIEALSSLARVVLRLVGRSPVEEGRSLVAHADVDGSSPRRGVVHAGWTAVVATVNGVAHRRAALKHRGRGTVVIYDRFVLDSVVRMRFLYGREEPLALPRQIVRALSPSAVAAFWLDVAAERAYARKPEHWDVEQLAAQRELYTQEHARLGVQRLDGERSREDLAAEIAAEVWLSL